jgi:hypothetical protein
MRCTGGGGIAPRILWPRQRKEVSGQPLALADLPPGARASSNHWTGGWMGPRAGPEGVEKRKIPSSPAGSGVIMPNA